MSNLYTVGSVLVLVYDFRATTEILILIILTLDYSLEVFK